MLSGSLDSKLCKYGESVDGLVYDDKLGYRCLPLLYWFCLVLTSPKGPSSAKEHWKYASEITLAGISCDHLFMLWLITLWASFWLLNSLRPSIIFIFICIEKLVLAIWHIMWIRMSTYAFYSGGRVTQVVVTIGH